MAEKIWIWSQRRCYLWLPGSTKTKITSAQEGWPEKRGGPFSACGPRRLLAYMEDTWRHSGISNTWSMPLLGRRIGAEISGDFPQSGRSKNGKNAKIHSQRSQEIPIKIKMTQNHWVVLVPFPSNSHCSHSRRRFCLRSGFDASSAPIHSHWVMLSAAFSQPSNFWEKKGFSKLLWIRVTTMVCLLPLFPFHPTPTAAVTSIRISSEVEPQETREVFVFKPKKCKVSDWDIEIMMDHRHLCHV